LEAKLKRARGLAVNGAGQQSRAWGATAATPALRVNVCEGSRQSKQLPDHLAETRKRSADRDEPRRRQLFFEFAWALLAAVTKLLLVPSPNRLTQADEFTD